MLLDFKIVLLVDTAVCGHPTHLNWKHIWHREQSLNPLIFLLNSCGVNTDWWLGWGLFSLSPDNRLFWRHTVGHFRKVYLSRDVQAEEAEYSSLWTTLWVLAIPDLKAQSGVPDEVVFKIWVLVFIHPQLAPSSQSQQKGAGKMCCTSFALNPCLSHLCDITSALFHDITKIYLYH